MATINGGRPGDPIRQFFNKLDGSKSKCINCGEKVSSKIERLRAHMKQCPKVAPTADAIMTPKRPATEQQPADCDTNRVDQRRRQIRRVPNKPYWVRVKVRVRVGLWFG